MRSGLRSAILGAIARLRRYPHQERPNLTESERDRREHKDNTANHRETPTADMLRAEWTALQTLIREIHRSEEQHQATQRDLGVAQLRTAQGLNWVTGIGAAVGVVGLLIVGGSLIVAIRSANDARDALHAGQRPWIVAKSIIGLSADYYPTELCHIGYRVIIQNTGNSVATSLIFDSRAVRLPPTWIWLKERVDKLRDDTVKLWSTKRPKGLPVGIVLAPQQSINPPRCPCFADGNDPSDAQIKTGAFLIIGYAQYRDQFGLPHHTRFAFTPTSDSAHPWDGQTFMIYNDYQDAD
jgi:hypothetical protein